MAEPTPRRFVLLRHAGHGTLHFDLMIEDGTALATWQFELSPTLLAPDGTFACRRLAAHRTTYLDYTGPVSNKRGHVHRSESGICDVTATASRWNIQFHGTMLRGRFTLKQTAGNDWLLTRG